MNHRFPSVIMTLCALLLSILWTPAARAAVEVHFYSREMGVNFPHAFIIVDGKLDGTGERVSGNYGWTPRTASPALLLGSVGGYVQFLKPDYIAKSNRQFSITLDDAGYAKLMKRIAEWQERKQPSYSLNKANCVHFIMDVADSAGLAVNRATKFLKKPRSFLTEVRGLNPKVK